MVKKIKTVAEAKKLKFGDQYIIDVFPDNPEDVTDAQIAKAEKLQKTIVEAVSDDN